MSEQSDRTILQCASQLLIECGMLSAGEAQSLVSENRCQKICSDGSTRRFWRLTQADKDLCIIAAPAGSSTAEIAESRSAWKIGRHLHAKGVAVPELYGWHEETGVLLFEDLGDVRLHDILAGKTSGQDEGRDRDHYREVLQQLVAMQLQGADDFDPDWCWDSPRYDMSLMLEKESGYFLRAFWQGLLGQHDGGDAEEEFRDIAAHVAKAATDFFLHRDFQSRNIMVQDGRLRFIDFQAGRFGPLGYDVASLLIDPYAALAPPMQEELLEYYCSILAAQRPGSEEDFHTYYRFLAVQRNLQIIGAFSFLSKVRGKPFFSTFIKPALQSLRDRLADESFAKYHRVRSLVDRGLAMIQAA